MYRELTERVILDPCRCHCHAGDSLHVDGHCRERQEKRRTGFVVGQSWEDAFVFLTSCERFHEMPERFNRWHIVADNLFSGSHHSHILRSAREPTYNKMR